MKTTQAPESAGLIPIDVLMTTPAELPTLAGQLAESAHVYVWTSGDNTAEIGDVVASITAAGLRWRTCAWVVIEGERPEGLPLFDRLRSPESRVIGFVWLASKGRKIKRQDKGVHQIMYATNKIDAHAKVVEACEQLIGTAHHMVSTWSDEA